MGAFHFLFQDRSKWDEKIVTAMDEALATDNFSDAWVHTAATCLCEELLAKAGDIRRAETKRRLNAKAIEACYQYYAAYANEKYGRDPAYVVAVLRKADALPYRLLQEAKKIKKTRK